MQIITTYGQNPSDFNNEVFLNPLNAQGIVEDFRLLTEWDARASGATNGGTTALTADSQAGEVTLTPGSGAGCHLELKTECFSTNNAGVVYMVARAKFNTAGQYFIGCTQKVATNSAVISSNALGAGTGCGFLIQTDDKADIISRDAAGTPVNVRTQDVITLTADTYYNFGITLTDTLATFYVNGKKIGTTAIAGGMGSGTAKNVVPSFEANTNAKVLTVDLCQVWQKR